MIRKPWFQWLLLAFALIIYAKFAVWNTFHTIHDNDFKHLYLGMQSILQGISPYTFEALSHQAALQGYEQISLNPYVYLPFTGQAMAFLSPLSLEQASTAWFVLNHVFMIGSILLLSQLFPRWRIGSVAIMVLVMAVNVPFHRTLSAGQLNVVLLFLICLGWHTMRRNRPAISGIIMAFAALYKLMPGLYGVYYLTRRKWTAAIAMTISGLIMFAVSTALSGWTMLRDFFPVLDQMGYGKSTWPWAFSFWDDPPNQSLNAFFSHIFTVNDHTTPWLHYGQATANLVTVAVTVGLITLYLAVNIVTRPRASSGQFSETDNAAWCSTLILALLIPSLCWDHYLMMLLLPVVWMASQAMAQKRWATLGILVICQVIISIPWDFAAVPWRSGAGILLMSLKLWPTLLLFGLSLCFMIWTWKASVSTTTANTVPGNIEPETLHEL